MQSPNSIHPCKSCLLFSSFPIHFFPSSGEKSHLNSKTNKSGKTTKNVEVRLRRVTKGKETKICVCVLLHSGNGKSFVFSASFSVLFCKPLLKNCYKVVFQFSVGLWPDPTLTIFFPPLQEVNNRETLKSYKKFEWLTMSVVDMWRFSDDINTARRFNAVAARMQPHCPVLYSGREINHSTMTNLSGMEKLSRVCRIFSCPNLIRTTEATKFVYTRISYTLGIYPNTRSLSNELQLNKNFWWKKKCAWNIN